jgi:ubiquinone/menaquinone biosynthesis C-methylase UbiE
MHRWVNKNQQAHWNGRTFYRKATDPAAKAFTVPKIDWFCEQLQLRDDATVLDVGAGTGVFTYWWAQRFSSVTGLEQSENMIERSPVSELMQQGDAYDLPFQDDSFDLVFTGNLLHHLERPDAALREMGRVARVGVAVCEPNRNHPPMAAFGVVSSACRGLLHYSRTTLGNLATDAGLNVRGVRLHGYIYENRSPEMSVPIASRLETVLPGGAYVLLAATP